MTLARKIIKRPALDAAEEFALGLAVILMTTVRSAVLAMDSREFFVHARRRKNAPRQAG